MDFTITFHGVLTTAGLLAAEHLLLYTPLKAYPLIKFILGTLAILAGCGVVAWESYDADILLVPFICAAGGGSVVALGYAGRWLYARAVNDAELRGWLKGLSDKGELSDGRSGEPDDRRIG